MSWSKPTNPMVGNWCWFCGRNRDECRGLAVGPSASICDQCAVEAVKATAPRVGSKQGGFTILRRLI
jgi:hypothetical protein